MNDIFDNSALEAITDQITKPKPIAELEALEAEAKLAWQPHIEQGLDLEKQQRFVEYFWRIGFLPKYKSYGVKYATPFGYSLFDLVDNAGFSIQIHETDKVEAFHILSTKSTSFILLATTQEWETGKDHFLESWQQLTPEKSPLAFKPMPGDVALVENLNTVHTVVGCVLEEFATSSYDVVTRLHDQNVNDQLVLPEKHTPVADVLRATQSLVPTQRIDKQNEWQATLLAETELIVDLNSQGLKGYHATIGEKALEITVDQGWVKTLVALEGETMVQVGELQWLLQPGTTTALAPNTKAKLMNASVYDKSRVSVCGVQTATAFADLR